MKMSLKFLYHFLFCPEVFCSTTFNTINLCRKSYLFFIKLMNVTDLGFLCHTLHRKIYTFFSNNKEKLSILVNINMTESNKSIHILKIIKSNCVSFRKNSIYFQNEITTFCERNANDYKICKCIYNLRANS